MTEILGYTVMDMLTALFTLALVCSFMLCEQKRARGAYYGLLVYQGIIMVFSVVTSIMLYRFSLAPTSSMPQWLLVTSKPWVAYVEQGIIAILATVILILEFPKVNWLMGIVAMGNLVALLRSGLYYLMRYFNLYHSPTTSLIRIHFPLWVIGAVMLGLWEFRRRDEGQKALNKTI